MKRLLAAIVLALVPALAHAQSVPLQGGPWVGGHVLQYANSGSAQPILMDAGNAAGGSAGVNPSEFAITARGTGTPPYASQGHGPNGELLCTYDAPTDNATGYHYLCLSPNADGGGLLSYGAAGGASELEFQILVNDSPASLPPGTAAAAEVYAGPVSGAAAAPSFRALELTDLPTIATARVLGNVSGSTAVPSALTATQLTTLCNAFTSGLSGCAPASGGGTSNFLRADGNWATPAGGGDVTGPGTSVNGNVVTWDGITGTSVADGGKGLPSGAIVGTTDVQTLTNKSISSTQITFTQTGTGATATTLGARATQGEIYLEDFGADCTGVADSTTAFTNAVTAAFTNGVQLRICQGTVKVTLASPISVTSGLSIVGAGGRQSIILNTSTTGSVLQIATTDAVNISNVGYMVSGTPSAGTFISDSGLSGSGTPNMNINSRFDNITCDNVWNCFSLQHSAAWVIDGGDFDNIYGTVLTVQNLAIQDWGDSTVTNSVFHLGQGASCSATTNNGILQYGSGGVRIANNKFNCGGIQYQLKAGGGGAVAVSSVTIIDGNSFENCNTACIWLTNNTSSSTWTNVIISDNEIAPYVASVSNIVIGGTSGWVSGVAITGNVLTVADSSSGVAVTYGDGISVVGNVMLPQSGSAGNNAYYLQNTATHCLVANNIETGIAGTNNCSAP